MADVDSSPEKKSLEQLDFTLDDIDDKEFDIPVVENPTLESILNETEDDSILPDDDLVSRDLLQGDSGDTGSLSSQEGILEGKPRKRVKKSIHYDKHGLVLRHVILKGISAQLHSAADRVDAGMSTAMAVSTLIAIGTSHGLVLVFDPKQVLRWCLGSTAVGSQYGAVSALSFNKDCTRLICGFARGQMTMWDLTNGKLLRTITDAHPPGTAILHVKFTDDLTLAVCSDSGGSVFELEMKRLIGVRTCESRCLFSGSRGEVCVIEPLHMKNNAPDHPMKDVIILAMASLTKVLIVTVRPQLKVLFMHQLNGDQSTLPLLAWQFVIIQVSEQNRVVDPVLAFARDQTIYFAQVFCSSADNIKVSPLQKTELPYKLLAVTWMNSRTMVALDTSERAHVIDVRTEEELEVLDIGDVQLVYSTSFYKSLATGGNVSKALAYAGERACYQSITTYNGQLVLLGTRGVHVLTLRSWHERLDVLVKHDKHEEALLLAQSFYDGKAKAVMGLAGGAAKRKATVAEKMVELLLNYIDMATTHQQPISGDDEEELQEYYQNVAPVCIENCLMLERLDILFGDIYDRMSADPVGRGVFLECLEPYILSDQLTSITPAVMQDFVSHCQERGLLRNVEACIVHMDIASLDIHQVVVLCWANGLYDAILYIYNRGMYDFITPLEELLHLLTKAVNSGKQLSDEQIKLGNKLLVYISCCLAGRAYPLGDIPDHLVSEVKEKVFKCVTCLHTKDHNEDEPVYPHLRTLLQFDTREFFNVLALAFEEEEFKSAEGVQQRQRVVDILLRIMVESVGFTPTQIGILFTFLARQMAKRDNTIMVNRVLFEQVLESLCTPGKDSRHEEREQALLELLSAGGLAHFEEQRLIRLAENARFYRVCEMLHENRREFNKILLCYLRDEYRQVQAFQFIEYILSEQHFSVEEKTQVREETLKNIKALVDIDSRKTSQLTMSHFSSSLSQIISQLQEDKRVLYEFLQGVFDYRENFGSALFAERQFPVDSNVQEIYIELMAEFNPENVCNYIKMADSYRIDEVLEICRRYQLSEATAHLLEKTGDVQGAFNLMLENLQSKMKSLTENLNSSGKEKDMELSWSRVQTALLVVIQLCQRNGNKLNEKQREDIWFPLLETCMLPQRQFKDKLLPSDLHAFKEITRHVLNGMMGYIALPAILQKIMQDPVYNTGRFGEIRELLLGMLDTYNYEKTLLRTCANLVNHDLHRQLAALTVAASRGISLKNDICSVCEKRITQTSEGAAVIGFRCGHGYHLACLRAVRSKVMLDGEETWLCYVCNKARRGGVTGRPRLLRPPSASQASSSLDHDSGKSSKAEVELEPEQIQALENLKRVQKSPSRMAILSELARQDRAATSSYKTAQARTSIFQNEYFQLQLSSPPPATIEM